MLGGADFQEFGNIGFVGSLQVISGTTVVRDIESDFFFQSINTEHAQGVEGVEERSHDGENPGADPQDGAELDQKEVGVTEVVEPSHVLGRVSGNALKILVGEKTDSDNSPSTVGEVDWDGIDSVIDLHHDEEFGESVVDQTTDKSNDDSGPWCNNGASSSDGNKTTKGSIHGHSQIIRGFSGLLGFHETVESHGTDTSAGSGHGGGDSAKAGSSGRSFVGNGQGRSWVESVPSEPKDESSKDLKGSGVSWELSRGFEGVSVFIVESSSARSKDGSSNKSAAEGESVFEIRFRIKYEISIFNVLI